MVWKKSFSLPFEIEDDVEGCIQVVQLLLPCYRDLPSILANKRLHQCINCNRLCYRGQADSGHHSAVASFWLLNGKTWVNACVSLAIYLSIYSNKTRGCIAPWCCLYACFKDLTSENIYPVLLLLVLSVTEPVPPSHPADPRHPDVCTSC